MQEYIVGGMIGFLLAFLFLETCCLINEYINTKTEDKHINKRA